MSKFSIIILKFKIVKTDKRNRSKKYEEKYSVLFLSHVQTKDNFLSNWAREKITIMDLVLFLSHEKKWRIIFFCSEFDGQKRGNFLSNSAKEKIVNHNWRSCSIFVSWKKMNDMSFQSYKNFITLNYQKNIWPLTFFYDCQKKRRA